VARFKENYERNFNYGIKPFVCFGIIYLNILSYELLNTQIDKLFYMFMMKLNIAALLAGLLMIMPAHAQNNAEDSLLDLHEAVSMAMENNPAYMTLQGMRNEVKHNWKSESGIVQPELSYTREGLGDTDQFFEQRMSISQSLEQPFSVIQKSKAADWRLKALNKRIEAYGRQLKEDVKMQYIELLYAIHMDSLRAERIRTAEKLREAVEFKFEQGSADKIDVLNARVRLDKAKNEKNNSLPNCIGKGTACLNSLVWILSNKSTKFALPTAFRPTNHAFLRIQCWLPWRITRRMNNTV